MDSVASLARIPHCAAMFNSSPIQEFPMQQHADGFRKLSRSSIRPLKSSETGGYVWSSLNGRQAHSSLVARKASSGLAVPVSQLTDFADQEAVRFREGLIKLLEPEESLRDVKGKIADVCTKIFRSFVVEYSGELPPEPFGKMRRALESQGLPGVKAASAALGWSRCNLYYDWKQWTGSDN